MDAVQLLWLQRRRENVHLEPIQLLIAEGSILCGTFNSEQLLQCCMLKVQWSPFATVKELING